MDDMLESAMCSTLGIMNTLSMILTNRRTVCLNCLDDDARGITRYVSTQNRNYIKRETYNLHLSEAIVVVIGLAAGCSTLSRFSFSSRRDLLRDFKYVNY